MVLYFNSLLKYISLNEHVTGAGKSVLKPWSERFDTKKVIISQFSNNCNSM